MPRTAINVLELNGPSGSGSATPTWSNGDQPNQMYWLARDGDILVMRNGGATPRQVDVYGPIDEMGRPVDADSKSTFTLAAQGSANDKRYWGPFLTGGWVQSGADSGRIHVDVAHSDVKLVVLRRR